MSKIHIIKGEFEKSLELQLANSIKAGFPSPAEDYRHDSLDFNRDLIKHPEATFYGRVDGDSMVEAGINDLQRQIHQKVVARLNARGQSEHLTPTPTTLLRIGTDIEEIIREHYYQELDPSQEYRLPLLTLAVTKRLRRRQTRLAAASDAPGAPDARAKEM